MDIKCKDQYEGNGFVLYNGDSCEIMKAIPDNSIHYSIFSPPFAELYVYSNTVRDISNCKDIEEFSEQMKFILSELYRIMMNGRLVSIHCMDLCTQKQRDGFIGIYDLSGLMIRLFQDAGFIYHSRVTIWKDPVVAMQRTKAIGLLYKQLKKDSAMSRQGLADYVLTFRKPGENEERIEHDEDTFPLPLWTKYASPVWNDINPSDTLQRQSAKEQADEKHMTPTQLSVWERCIELWTNPNDIVFTPFLGIGSEVYQALKMGRRGVGIELKESYYNQAVANCKGIAAAPKKLSLF
jgi:DNA modification methylase